MVARQIQYETLRLSIRLFSAILIIATAPLYPAQGAPLILEDTTPSRIISAPQDLGKPFVAAESLNDPYNRISADFKIPDDLKARTAFWFDIYTKYGSDDHVIHHSQYPWLIFKVVDTAPIFKTNLNKWTKYHMAEKAVRHDSREIRSTLIKMSRRKKFDNLNDLEKTLYDTLAVLPGPRAKVFRTAARSVRVQLGQKDFFISGLLWSTKYLPIMEKEFAANGLPMELTRLPFVESSFNVNAESKVGASGIWQIMPAVGKAYLIVNNQIDERNSPLKASLVAVKLFKQNYKALGSWPLAVTAYNHGAKGVKQAANVVDSKNIAEIIAHYNRGSFQFASANFYTCFLAALHAERYHNEIFQDGGQATAEPLPHTILSLKRPIRLKNLLKTAKLDRSTLLEFNLDLRSALKSNPILPRGYHVILPPQTAAQLENDSHFKTDFFQEASFSVKRNQSG